MATVQQVEIKRPGLLLALVLVGVLYGAALVTATMWLQRRLALRAAYPDPADREGVHVVLVTKPSTVTFSNGESVDVGPWPWRVTPCVTVPALLAGLAALGALGARWGMVATPVRSSDPPDDPPAA
jgi:ABC-type Na+ efflux pump permease subunit